MSNWVKRLLEYMEDIDLIQRDKLSDGIYTLAEALKC